ncbi:transposase [Paenibacillus sp. OAS669]|uniref:transposase n=1 Tax=Paenibacillus sp. OAS669 TaxID=2663821 RepID=UPI0039A16EDB
MYANCEAVLWVARTGASWHYLPDYNGPWSSAYSFFWRTYYHKQSQPFAKNP